MLVARIELNVYLYKYAS